MKPTLAILLSLFVVAASNADEMTIHWRQMVSSLDRPDPVAPYSRNKNRGHYGR